MGRQNSPSPDAFAGRLRVGLGKDTSCVTSHHESGSTNQTSHVTEENADKVSHVLDN